MSLFLLTSQVGIANLSIQLVQLTKGRQKVRKLTCEVQGPFNAMLKTEIILKSQSNYLFERDPDLRRRLSRDLQF